MITNSIMFEEIRDTTMAITINDTIIVITIRGTTIVTIKMPSFYKNLTLMLSP